MVACMDTRIDPLHIMRASPGDLHVIRNAGGLVTDDTLRSLLISQGILGTKSVLVMMHTDCGMLELDERKLIEELIEGGQPAPPFSLGGFPDVHSQLRASVDRIRGCEFLPEVDRVTGSIYDIAAGRLMTVIG